MQDLCLSRVSGMIAAPTELASLSQGTGLGAAPEGAGVRPAGTDTDRVDEQAREPVRAGVEALTQAGIDAHGRYARPYSGTRRVRPSKMPRNISQASSSWAPGAGATLLGAMLGSTAHKVIHLTGGLVLVVR